MLRECVCVCVCVCVKSGVSHTATTACGERVAASPLNGCIVLGGSRPVCSQYNSPSTGWFLGGLGGAVEREAPRGDPA